MIPRMQLFAAVCGITLACAEASLAAVPDASHCTVSDVLVGSSSGVKFPTVNPNDGTGFQVTVRNTINAPMAGSTVVVDFAAAAGVKVYTSTPGATVDCALHRVSGITDSNGYVQFGMCIGGHEYDTNATTVSADGVLLRALPVRSTDIDAVGGVTDVNDLNLLRVHLFGETGFDYNLDFDLSVSHDVGDLNLFRRDLFSGAVGAYCP